MKPQENIPQNTPSNDMPGTPVIDIPTSTEPTGVTPTSSLPTTSLPAELAAKIIWTPPRPIARQGFLETNKNQFNYEEQSDYAEIGTYTYNGQSGRVILLAVPAEPGRRNFS
jgi:hypothetical protein